jgi:hypothetical protein
MSIFAGDAAQVPAHRSEGSSQVSEDSRAGKLLTLPANFAHSAERRFPLNSSHSD